MALSNLTTLCLQSWGIRNLVTLSRGWQFSLRRLVSHLERLNNRRVPEGWACQSSGGIFVPPSGAWTEMPARLRLLTSVYLLEFSMFLGLVSPLEGTLKASPPSEPDVPPALYQLTSECYLSVLPLFSLGWQTHPDHLLDIKNTPYDILNVLSFQPVHVSFLVVRTTGFPLVWESKWPKFFMMHRALCG